MKNYDHNDKTLDEWIIFGKMVQSQHRNSFECFSEGFIGHIDIMEL